jgi:Transglycosylase SLT domain
VPLNVLVAVAGAESGWHPWALNIDGRETYCRSRSEASSTMSSTDNVDVGLMQINYRLWGRRLGVTKEQLLEPSTNLLEGARILRSCLGTALRRLTPTGTGYRKRLWHCIGAYHSPHRRERARYDRRVYATYLDYLSRFAAIH